MASIKPFSNRVLRAKLGAFRQPAQDLGFRLRGVVGENLG